MNKWLVFVKERFNPFAYGTMILCVSFSHFVVLRNEFLQETQILLPLTLFFMFFFFKLRCYDEIKDYQHDLIHNPTRPLARGVLSVRDMYLSIIICWIFEIALLSWIGTRVFIFVLPSLVYTLLMFKEFFVGKFLRPHLTTYALSHTFVFFLVSFSIYFSISSSVSFLALVLLALPHWFLFNLFEFARKTFSVEEEKPEVQSYSKIFGKLGASLLSISQLVLALICFPVLTIHLEIAHSVKSFSWTDSVPLVVLALVLFSAFLFIVKNNKKSALLFRKCSEISIVACYLYSIVRFF
jgi:4-hydroxybenzoate polyprenyltransferase